MTWAGGRPTKSETDRRIRTAAFAATPTEFALLTRNADAAGLSLSAYLRAVILQSTGIAPPPQDHRLRVAAVRELSRIGNNLNQIARSYNIGNDRSDALADALHQLERTIMELIDHDA